MHAKNHFESQSAHSAQVGFCTPSARCHPEYSQTRAAVIDIYAINLSLGAMALCTGASLFLWQVKVTSRG